MRGDIEDERQIEKRLSERSGRREGETEIEETREIVGGEESEKRDRKERSEG